MNTIKLTPDNVSQYIGCEILFKTGPAKNHIVKRILRVTNSGKTIHIDCPHLNNNVQIVTRIVHVIIE